MPQEPVVPFLVPHYGMCYLLIVWSLRLSCWLTCTHDEVKLGGEHAIGFDVEHDVPLACPMGYVITLLLFKIFFHYGCQATTGREA